jgi:uncharacterized protein YbaR (Trm112 family)
MNVKEEIAKLTAGQLTTLILGLIGSLFLIVLQGTLFLLWTRIEPEISKRTLEAALALVAIIITILLVSAVTLLFFLFRVRRKASEPQMIKRFGVLWDSGQEPHCPVDQTLMRVRVRGGDRDYDMLLCPKCHNKYPLRTDDLMPLLLPVAQTLLQSDRGVAELASEPKPVRRFGIHWDSDMNPLCPLDDVLLPMIDKGVYEHLGQPYELFRCPKCKTQFQLRDDSGRRVMIVEAKTILASEKTSQ